VGYSVTDPSDLSWITRPHEPGEPARHVAELSDAKGRRHRHIAQEETFVVLAGALTMYLGEPPVRVDVPGGGVVRVDPGTALQTVNHGDEDLIVWAVGYPPEHEHSELLESAV